MNLPLTSLPTTRLNPPPPTRPTSTQSSLPRASLPPSPPRGVLPVPHRTPSFPRHPPVRTSLPRRPIPRRHVAPAAALPLPNEAAQVAVDAWSVTGGTTLGARFTGVETQLFQAGLLPYLAYLWFLNKDERTPEESNFGARFLLLFVFATIPAGIAAKKVFGDILANVDILHGSSESLLSISNLLFALGFASALEAASASSNQEPGSSAAANQKPAVSKLKAVGVLAAVAGGGTALATAAIALAGGAAALSGGALHSEPYNALSLPTWAVHVTSVSEWALAMRLVWMFADSPASGRKQQWKGLTLAMSPFLASGLAACTFHLFYNAPSINALVPLQALLTLTGNTGCAIAAYRIATAPDTATATATATGSASLAAVDAEPPTDAGAGGDDDDFETTFALKLAALSVLGSLLIKYGELAAGDFFFTPSYPKALSLIGVPTALWLYLVTQSTPRGGMAEEEGKEGFWQTLSMDKVKSYGAAGTVSYVITELAFWAVAFPVAIGWYRVAEGSWLDLNDTADKAKLLGAGAVFINGVRALVPLRLAAALALAPTVKNAMETAGVMQGANDSGDDDDDDAPPSPPQGGADSGGGGGGGSNGGDGDDGTWSISTLLKGFAGAGAGPAGTAGVTGPPSDLPSLRATLPDCPLTRWDAAGIDIARAQADARAEALPQCPLPVLCPGEVAGEEEAELRWIAENRDRLKALLLEHGCLHFQGFTTMKQAAGFRRFNEAMSLSACLDPIHTSGLRKFAVEQDAIYEEVNKPSLRGHYIGLHNESTTMRAAAMGAFVCFQPATVSGGQFLIADGAKILRDMDPAVLQRFYDRKIRISVSNLDFFAPLIKDRGVPTPEVSLQLQDRCKKDLATLIGDTVAPKFDMNLEMLWGADGAQDGLRLQAVEEAELPLNRHPITGRPVWFSNMHNHSRYLRDHRPCTVPEVGMTEVFYGDMGRIPPEDLDEVRRVSEGSIVPVAMTAGEVVLVDNYRVLHGRDVFEGDRCHAVTWFTWPEEAADAATSESNTDTGDRLNKLLNGYLDTLNK